MKKTPGGKHVAKERGAFNAAAVKPESGGARGLSVEYWPIGKVKPYPKNPRKPSESSVKKVMASIQEFGWRQPIVVDKAGVIVAGHKRWEAANKMELKLVPVHVAKELTESQIKAYRIMDNRSQDDSEWDLELLAEEVGDLSKLETIDLSLTGLDDPEIKEFLAQCAHTEGLTDPEAIPEPPSNPVSITGDLWLMGKHRLLCGDSTSVEAVAQLMAGERAGLMNTDPPYGIGYDSAEIHEHGVSLAAIANDEHRDSDLQNFLERVFSAALTALFPNAAWYLWHAMLTQGFFAAAAAAAAHVILHRQIIWVKPVLVFGRGYYHWKHELCFMGWVQGNKPPDYGDHKETTIWEVSGLARNERQDIAHPTPKPTGLFSLPIRKHLRAGEICYEPFAGSGPQFIAAEEAGVRCFGLELAPQYVDVIVNRWQKFTGQKATLEGDGRAFDEIAIERRQQAAAA